MYPKKSLTQLSSRLIVTGRRLVLFHPSPTLRRIIGGSINGSVVDHGALAVSLGPGGADHQAGGGAALLLANRLQIHVML
uniref:Uncharacterized protein n=1 Tax=Arundo donax TaxID=35708 RepID=A0A0A9HEJ8_ARUDO